MIKTTGTIASVLAGAALCLSVAVQADGMDRRRSVNNDYVAPPPAYRWTGFSVGLGLGAAMLQSDVNVSASRTDDIRLCDPADCGGTFLTLVALTQAQSFNFDGLGDAGVFGTAQLAYDFQVSSNVVVGAFVDVDWSSDLNSNFSASSSSSLSILPGVLDIGIPLSQISINGKVEHEWSVTVGGRIGLLATPSTLLYVLAGYTHVELDSSNVQVNILDPIGQFIPPIDSPTNLSFKLPDSLDGYTVGAGVETKLTNALSLKFEYRYTDLDGISAALSNNRVQCCIVIIGRGIQEDAKVDVDLDVHSVRAVLSYKFGHDPVPVPMK